MSDKKKLKEQNHEYWINRAESYSDVNKEELAGIQKETWSRLLDEKIKERFGDKKDIKILDIGAGPGFISIILSRLGYNVTAADFAETMIEQAKLNAGDLADKITFIQQDACDLTFEDETFDVVFSRNLTWNLPSPSDAYSEWVRVLKKDGLLMTFDANWYAYLFDNEKMEGFIKDRENSKEADLGDFNVGETFDVMEDIARKLPLSDIKRPEWDVEFLKAKGLKDVYYVEDIGERVYSEKEKINYSSTPMFMVSGVKG